MWSVPQRGAKANSNTGLNNEIHHILTHIRNEESTNNYEVSQNGDKDTDSTADLEFLDDIVVNTQTNNRLREMCLDDEVVG